MKSSLRPGLIKISLILIVTSLTCALTAHPLDNWHGRYTNAALSSLPGVAFGNGRFVAVGSGGAILLSETGHAWASQISGTTQSLRDVAFGNGNFVAVGTGGTILTSPDGMNWTQRTCPGISNTIGAIRFNDNRFVAASSPLVAISTDAINWIAQNVGTNFDSGGFASGNGLVVLEHKRGTNLVSTDGTNWFPRPSGSPWGLYTIGFGNGMFVSIDINNESFTSPDATSWTQQASVNSLRPSCIAYGGGHFVTVGGGPILFSKLPSIWNVSSNGYLYVGRSVAFGRGTFVAVGDDGVAGRIMQSNPLLRIESTGTGKLAIFGPLGTSISVERSETLASSNAWQLVTNFSLTASPLFWSDSPPNSQQHFYRAFMLP